MSLPFRHRALNAHWLLPALLLALLAQLSTAGEAPRRKVIIDDDGFGLMHLTLIEGGDLDILGITTVSGNAWVNRLTATALRSLERIGRTDLPVYAGATHPLVNSEALTDRWESLYGKLTWKGAWMKAWVEPTTQSTPPYYTADAPVNLPEGNPTTKARAESAAAFMVRMVREHPGEVTIIEAGPMTNLALAQRLDPQFASLARELIYMGGSFNPRQVLDNQSAAEFAREFTNSPRREFNIRFDPEAASIVARAPWRKITVVPVDPSTATQLTPALLERLAGAARPPVAAYVRAMEPGFPLWDEIITGAWLEPGLVTQRERLYVDFDTQFGPAYGDTLSWREHYQPRMGEQAADVVLAVDPRRLEDLLVRRLAAGKR